MTPDALVADLRATLAAPGAPITARIAALNSAVARGDLAASTVAEAALRLLETLTDADGILDMTATELLTNYGDGSALPRLRAVRPRLRPRIAMRDWRFEVDRVVTVLEARAAGRCECAAEAAHGAPVWGPNWAVEEETSPEPYVLRRIVRCTRCGRRWTVLEEDGYHYPLFRWDG